MDLVTISAWAAIGQFVFAVLSFIVQVRQGGTKTSTRPVLWFVLFSAMILTLPGGLFVIGAIMLSTLSKATATEIVLRVGSISMILGIIWGVIWALFMLPRVRTWFGF